MVALSRFAECEPQGAAIRVAAVATVVRHKEYGHIAPGVVLTALSALDLALLAG
jgi:hypothetical protein